MPRRLRDGTGQHVFHVLNRAIEGLVLFHTPSDYRGFLRIFCDTTTLEPMRLLAFCVMPTHWHLVLWPPDDTALSSFMKRLSATHAQYWRRGRESIGRGAVYQGRYKAIAVQDDQHLWQVVRYVERNALRAKLVAAAEDWEWCSAWRAGGRDRPALTPWIEPRPADWLEVLNQPEPPAMLSRVREAVRRGAHFGSASWRQQVCRQVRWREGRRGRSQAAAGAGQDGDDPAGGRPGPTNL